MQFSQDFGKQSPMDLIPAGVLLWAMVSFRGMKRSEAGGSYADMEYIIAEGQPFARKHIFDIVSDPDFAGNSEAAMQMGMVALTRMVESSGLVDVNSAEGYAPVNGKSCEQVMSMLDGKYVAVRVKIEKGTGGYQDKNKIGEYLTPNTTSSGYKNYLKLSNKDHNLPSTNSAVGNGAFGQRPATQAPKAQPGFGFTPAPASQTAEAAPAEAAPTPKAVTTGFDPNKPPGWLGNTKA